MSDAASISKEGLQPQDRIGIQTIGDLVIVPIQPHGIHLAPADTMGNDSVANPWVLLEVDEILEQVGMSFSNRP